jgi:hypothetical protein
MADYCCNYCQDMGDCARCSYFFEENKPHSKCGRLWKDHEIITQPASNQGIYPPAAKCPR